MITIKNTYLEYFIKEDKQADYLIVLNLTDGNYDWTIYDKTGMAADINGNDLLVVSKFLDDFYNIKEGKVNECEHVFKYENNKYYFQTIQPNEYKIKEDYSDNLSQLINQLTGLNMSGISKYVVGNKHLIIEIKEDLFEFDTEIISTISSIINGDGDNEEIYNISFINILGNEIIRAKYYDLTKGKETNGNAYACVAIFDYFATINDLSYDNPLDITILLNDDIVRIFYKSDKYFVSYKPVLL
jgi:diaminopimelate epimerase